MSDELTGLTARANTGDMAACHELHQRAGAGCIEAQRAIRDQLLDHAGPMNDGWGEVLLRAVILCRMIAARGNFDDGHRLASVLFCTALERRKIGDDFLANSSAFEAMGVLRDLADEGDGVALKWLADVAPHWPDAASVIERASLPGHDVTAIPPPIITTFAPYPALSWRTRMAIRWDNAVWSVRIWWWGVVDRFNMRGS